MKNRDAKNTALLTDKYGFTLFEGEIMDRLFERNQENEFVKIVLQQLPSEELQKEFLNRLDADPTEREVDLIYMVSDSRVAILGDKAGG